LQRVRFSYQAPTIGFHSVGICGDFTAWQIIPLTDVGGSYEYLTYLYPGTYRYKFVVDDLWIADPQNPHREADPFGGENSLLIVKGIPKAITWNDLQKTPEALIGSITPPQMPYATNQGLCTILKSSATALEIRFHWFTELPCSVLMSINNQIRELRHLGIVDRITIYHCMLDISNLEGLSLYFVLVKGNTRYYYSYKGFHSTSELPLPIAIMPQDLPLFEVPDWIAHGVIYQIFPDRFCNGNPDINPDFREWYYDSCKTPPPQGKQLAPHQEYFHFVEDWEDTSALVQSPYLPLGKPDWWSFYGGDIAGIISKLDYLRDLGISIIYLNPLWQAKSNHKYDAADFLKIDPHFGSEQELKNLVSQAHQRGIRIILDVAFNHTGETFWAFRDCLAKGPFSEYWNWYDWHKYPLPDPLPVDFDPKEYYQCWWGIKDMPDLNYDLSRMHPDENKIKDISHAVVNTPVVEHILQCVDYWLGKMDLDGFRLDVPDEVPYWFWELFRSRVKSIKADAWLVGEIWHNAEDWISPRYFDSVMNYAYFKNPVIDYLISGLISLDEFQAKILEGFARYPFHAAKAMMNLLGGHDTIRIIELALGDIRKVQLAMIFQFCFVGTPHIYYGDEIGMGGKRDPDNRRPFDWKWENNRAAVFLRVFVKELIQLRKKYPALISGEFSFIFIDNDICHFRRYDNEQSLYILINPSLHPKHYPKIENASLIFALENSKEGTLLAQDAKIYLSAKTSPSSCIHIPAGDVAGIEP